MKTSERIRKEVTGKEIKPNSKENPIKQRLMNNLMLRTLGGDIEDIPTDYYTGHNDSYGFWITLFANREISKREFIYRQMTDGYIQEAIQKFRRGFANIEFMALNHIEDEAVIGIVFSRERLVPSGN